MTDMDSNNVDHPLVAEVRQIRRDICEETGHDVDRLCDHLVEIGRDFDERRGVFAGVNKAAAACVIKGWGDDAHRRDDAIVDEIRAIRKKNTDEA